MAGTAIQVLIRRGFGLNLLFLFMLLASLFITPGSASAETPGPFEQVLTISFPAGYGELLNIYGDSLANGAPAAAKEISEKLNFYNQAIGRISGGLDIGGKLYLGQTQEAAISAGLLILGEAAGSQAGKAYLGAMGLTTLPVTTLITAFQIYQLSASELQKSTIGVKLESLYGMIESDARLKNRSRDVGVGDPIPVTQESVEYLWRKVLLEDRWRDLFKTYVVEELSKDWPESSRWSRWAAPGNVIEEAEMLDRRDELKGYIAGLLSFLNRAAMVREQQYVMRKYADELKQKSSGMSSASVLQKYMGAIGMLPEVRDFVKNCPARIQQGVNGNDLSPLIQVVNNSKRYAVDVLAWIPGTGKLGIERESLLKQLRSYHDQAWSAREFLQEKRKRDELQKAAAAQVTVWRASSFGFPLTFDDLRGAIDEEFQKTGAISQVNKNIYEQSQKMRKHYDDQGISAQKEYKEAQQMRPVPAERNQQALNQFGVQLSAYHTIDQQLLSEVNAEIAAYVETLKWQAKLKVEKLREAVIEIETRIRPFQTTTWAAGRAVGGIRGLEETLAGYCGTFPSAGYVGLGRLKFPQTTFKSGDHYHSFSGRNGAHLQSLAQRIAEQDMYIQFCGGRAYLPGLISGIDGMIALVDSFLGRKEEVIALEEKVLELEQLLEQSRSATNQRMVDYYTKQLEENHRPFAKKLNDLLKKGEALKGPARAAQQQYQTDLANMENDLAYLGQLRAILGQISQLDTFIAKYPGISLNGRNGTFVLRPEISAEYTEGQCKALIGRQVFMTKDDIRQARQRLDSDLANSRLVWMDQNYNLGLKEFVDMYIADRTGLVRMSAPANYTFIDLRGECRIITKDYFDKLKDKLDKVDGKGVYFERNMQSAVSSDYLSLLSIPMRSQPVELVSIDLANYPANGLDFLREVAKGCWEDQTRAAVLGVVTAFENKLAAYRSWNDSEAYYQQMMQRFSNVLGNLDSLEFDANAAYNKDMYDPVVKTLYQQAAAKESAVMGFLASAASDSKLSPDRQDNFARLSTEFKKRFFFIRQWAGKSFTRPSALNENLTRDFYDKFKEAYESRNESEVMAMIGDNWESGDGTTLSDLQGYLRNSFTVFDQITYKISQLTSSWSGSAYNVSYDVIITGRNFRHNLKHEEKSSVNEEVSLDSSGKPRITRTFNGRFWYVQ